jgi:lysophospholipase L1-like esterase
VVLYAGDNDLQGGKSPATVAADFAAFCEKIHASLPATRIIYVSIKPSPSRWNLREKMVETNARIAALCAADARRKFVDVYTPMLDAKGQPRPELFLDDKLHLNRAGYELWTKALAPLLGEVPATRP